MKLSEHFSLEELIATQHRGIDNRPTDLALANLKLLAEVLEEVRLLLGTPMIISSGYRCPDLNELVGGARNSRHMLGLAADFISTDYGTPLKICQAIRDSRIMFDQLIQEFPDRYDGGWVHFGIAPDDTQPRVQVMHITMADEKYALGLKE